MVFKYYPTMEAMNFGYLRRRGGLLHGQPLRPGQDALLGGAGR